jgi:hypothetical protein
MNQLARLGANITGIGTSKGRAEAMQGYIAASSPTSVGSNEGAGTVRIAYARSGAELGSIPKPVEVADKLKSAVGLSPSPLVMDKLGERLAFERTGTRLYEALVSKHEAYGSFEGGPTREELQEILNDEHRHFAILAQIIRDAGGDPTAVSPSADLSAVASEGVGKVITDARTTLVQSLEAILIAELVDRDGWSMLCKAARNDGLEELAGFCERAEVTEETHLTRVRSWLEAAYRS